MAHGAFIWADLSTFRPDVTRGFYTALFGWAFDDYVGATKAGPAAGLYEMPQKFQKIRMPSFWMSYIGVDDVDRAMAIANETGGKVELGPETFPDGLGRYALIRDPLGAGFTVYEGTGLDGSATGQNARVAHHLFVSDAGAVRDFYTSLFGWSFGPSVEGTSPILAGGDVVAHLHEVPDPAVRGKEEYWAITFGVADLDEATSIVSRQGGQVIAEMDLPEGQASLVRDPDGAAFLIVESGSSAKRPSPTRRIPWRAWAGLALVLISSFSGQVWPWLIFLGAWIVTALRTKETYMFERITRHGSPGTYWAILLVYGVLFALVALLLWSDYAA